MGLNNYASVQTPTLSRAVAKSKFKMGKGASWIVWKPQFLLIKRFAPIQKTVSISYILYYYFPA